MKAIILDITGRTLNYDIALANAISVIISDSDELILMTPFQDVSKVSCKHRNLPSLVPKKYRDSTKAVKRYLKALECVLNYIFVLCYACFRRIDVIHFQWLPFLEFNSIELLILKLYKCLLKRTKFILTVHNIFPHDLSLEEKGQYKERFVEASEKFDSFIVHTETSKKELEEEFGVDNSLIYVVFHGILEPSDISVTDNTIKDNKWNVIIYGNQSLYKGTDIYFDALQLLPEQYKRRIRTTIAGYISNEYLSVLQSKSNGLEVDWMPYFVDENILNNKILESNLIVLPYRKISQSGVLLLALYFKKYILTSDLPAFKETLTGFTDDMFFENERPESLANTIKNYLDSNVNLEEQMSTINELNSKYSWAVSAKITLEIYKY